MTKADLKKQLRTGAVYHFSGKNGPHFLINQPGVAIIPFGKMKRHQLTNIGGLCNLTAGVCGQVA